METTQHNSNKRERVKSIDHFIESGEHAPNVGIEAVLREVFPEQEEELASGLVAGSLFGWTWGDGTVVAQCFNPCMSMQDLGNSDVVRSGLLVQVLLDGFPSFSPHRASILRRSILFEAGEVLEGKNLELVDVAKEGEWI